MPPRGVVKYKLAIGQLPTLNPVDIEIMLCDVLAPDFLIGRKTIRKWDYYSHHQEGDREDWKAGGYSMRVLSQNEANEYNEGLVRERLGFSRAEWAQTRRLWHPLRPEPEGAWTLVAKGGSKNPPRPVNLIPPGGKPPENPVPSSCRPPSQAAVPPRLGPEPPAQVN